MALSGPAPAIYYANVPERHQMRRPTSHKQFVIHKISLGTNIGRSVPSARAAICCPLALSTISPPPPSPPPPRPLLLRPGSVCIDNKDGQHALICEKYCRRNERLWRFVLNEPLPTYVAGKRARPITWLPCAAKLFMSWRREVHYFAHQHHVHYNSP